MNLRNRLKALARNSIAATIGNLHQSPNHLRVLTFHNIGNGSDADNTIRQQDFGNFLSIIKEEGYCTIRANDLFERWPSVLQDERIVVLTFDDGYASHHDRVPEYLARLGMVASFFVITSNLNSSRKRYQFSDVDNTFLSGEQIRELHAAGFEIGSHSHTHPILSMLSSDKISSELTISKDILEQELGHTIISFSYPYGRKSAISRDTRSLLEASGYLIGFSQEGKTIGSKTNLLEIPRINVNAYDNIKTFKYKLHGQYEVLSNLRDKLEYF